MTKLEEKILNLELMRLEEIMYSDVANGCREYSIREKYERYHPFSLLSIRNFMLFFNDILTHEFLYIDRMHCMLDDMLRFNYLSTDDRILYNFEDDNDNLQIPYIDRQMRNLQDYFTGAYIEDDDLPEIVNSPVTRDTMKCLTRPKFYTTILEIVNKEVIMHPYSRYRADPNSEEAFKTLQKLGYFKMGAVTLNTIINIYLWFMKEYVAKYGPLTENFTLKRDEIKKYLPYYVNYEYPADTVADVVNQELKSIKKLQATVKKLSVKYDKLAKKTFYKIGR